MSKEGIRQYTGGMPQASMNRRLGATETIYHLLDQLYCLNFVVFAEIDGPMDSGALDGALWALQEEQPLLRARVVRLRGQPWFRAVPQAQAALKAQVMPLRNWRAHLVAQLDIPFDHSAPLARCFWFGRGGRQSVAAMVFHHTIADGKSGSAMLARVLRRAAGEAIPLQFQAAHPSAQALDPIHHKGMVTSATQTLGFWWRQSKAALTFPRQLPGYDMQWRVQRHIHAIPLSLTPAQTRALQAACRAQSTTVHGALGAAQLLAMYGEFESPGTLALALTSLADLRGVLGGNLTSNDLGLYIATLTTVHTVTGPSDFWHLATQIKTQLAQTLHSGSANLIHSIYPHASGLPMVPHSVRLLQSAAALAPPSSMLTNIGKVQEIPLQNKARVHALAFMVAPPPQHPICVTVAGYADRIHIHLLYDQSKVSEIQAQRISDTLLGLLSSAVGTPCRT